MKIDITLQKIDTTKIKIGDILITSIGSAWLVACDCDYDYRVIDLTNSSVGQGETYFYDTHTLCTHIEDVEGSKIVRHIPGDKVKLTLLEG